MCPDEGAECGADDGLEPLVVRGRRHDPPGAHPGEIFPRTDLAGHSPALTYVYIYIRDDPPPNQRDLAGFSDRSIIIFTSVPEYSSCHERTGTNACNKQGVTVVVSNGTPPRAWASA